MQRETEIKLAIPSAAAGGRLLRDAGFHVSKRRVFEANTVFDTHGFALRRSGRLVRVREAGRRYVLTYKGRSEPGRHKSREELETEVSDARVFHAILKRLGYQPGFRYEKFRTEYKQAKGSGVATRDETPIGCFLELEGPPRWIDRIAKALGFTASDYITASYSELYVATCKRAGVAPSNMVFRTGKLRVNQRAADFRDTGGK